jgi:hypothetical protein
MSRAALLVLLILSGCDATSLGEAQRTFEFRALLPPEGITETTATGEVVRTDPDDWRTAPVYLSSFSLTFTPYPNPASPSEAIQVAGIFTGTVGALIPYRLDERERLTRLPVVSGQVEGTAPLYTFTAGQLGSPGLHRVVLLDATGRVVTYGDIEVIP